MTWDQLNQAQRENKTTTVIEIAAQLKKQEIDAQNWGLACKAIIREIYAKAQLDAGGEKTLTLLDQEIATAPEALRPALWALRGTALRNDLDTWSWRNSASSDEAELADPDNLDVTTWSEGRKFHEAILSYTKALESPEILQKLTLQDFEGILRPGLLDSEARPTFYDFIIRDVLNAIGSLASVHNGFIPSAANGLIPRDQFLTLEIPAGTWSPARSLTDQLGWQDGFRLWQELLAFHHKSDNLDALFHADLDRLEWMKNAVTGNAGNKAATLQTRLREIITEAAASPVATRARYLLGNIVLGDSLSTRTYRDPAETTGDPVAAREIFQAGATAHLLHPFGKMCFDQITVIDARSLNLRLRRTWLPGNRVAELTTRNLKKVWCRVYPIDFNARSWLLDKNLPLLANNNSLARFLNKKPTLTWSFDLADANDHRPAFTAVDCPANLPKGLYLMMVSDDENFSPKNSLISGGAFFRTDLTLALWGDSQDQEQLGFILNSQDGSPAEKVKVDAWWNERNSTNTVNRSAQSAADGSFLIKAPAGSQISLNHSDGSAVVTRLGWSGSGLLPHSTSSEILFFTDRQAYRPGQRVRFKGIVTTRANQFEPRKIAPAKTKVKVSFTGANGDTIATLQLQTNGFGSIHGEFEIPTTGLLGRSQIAASRFSGVARFSIEEYKRPVFEAKIESVGTPAALGEKVTAKVIATAFSGEALDGAKVVWTVTRSPRAIFYPRGRRSAAHLNLGNEQIASGEGTTDQSGSLEISFLAQPSPLVDLDANSRFDYEIEAEVISPSGESVDLSWSTLLGYADFHASLSLKDSSWITTDEEQEITLRTSTWQNDKIARSGSVKIFQVTQPETIPDTWISRHSQLKRDDGNNPLLEEIPAETNAEEGEFRFKKRFEAGEYRLLFKGKDPKGRPVSTHITFRVFDLAASSTTIRQSQIIMTDGKPVKPGENFRLLWASGFPQARACLDFIRDGKLLKRHWTAEGRTQELIEFPITEDMRGGVTICLTQVTQDQTFSQSFSIPVSDENQKLNLEWHHFTNKLEPGGRETWTAKVTLPQGDPAQAVEMVGTLYDASLDALFGSHHFSNPYSWWDRDRTGWSSPSSSHGDANTSIYAAWYNPGRAWQGGNLFAQWSEQISSASDFEMDFGFGDGERSGRLRLSAIAPAPAAMSIAESDEPFAKEEMPRGGGGGSNQKPKADSTDPFDSFPKTPATPVSEPENFTPVNPRTNFNETAFFFPTLVSNDDGTIEMSFVMPESATQWNFLGFAHNREKQFGTLSGETITALDFMVRPNPPRFLRVGDEMVLTARLVNQGKSTATGQATILLRRSRDEADVTNTFNLPSTSAPFEIPAGESTLVSWRIRVPEMTDWLIYRVSATATYPATDDAPAKTVGDGEERWLPVLSRRILVRDAATRTLTKPGEATLELSTLTQAKPASEGGPLTVGYTVEAVPRPAWLAVKALPYLMEYPHECSEQVFNRYFANALAQHLVNQNPEIEKVFEAWKREAAEAQGQPDPFTSPLARNPELKAVMLTETPFLMNAVSEREERLRIVNLFDQARMESELNRALDQLQEKQMPSGGWPWFAGDRARESFYVTSYLTAGFGRLRKIGVAEIDISMALQATQYLDQEMHKSYLEIMKDLDNDANYFNHSAALYLYARSFFIKDRAVSPIHRKSFEFWKDQATKHWNSIASLQTTAMLAVAMHRLDEPATAKLLMESLRENSLTHEDLGMHWRQLDRRGYLWWQAPIESQTAIIEAFLEVEDDKSAVTLCQTWLLQQKRTQHWESTKATADAVYAVLVDGSVDLLDRKSGGLTLTIGQREPIGHQADTPAEAGTGRLSYKPDPATVTQADGKIAITKTNEGPSWINVYWQSMQDIAEITARDTNNAEEGRDAALALAKSVFVARPTDQGEKLFPYQNGEALKIGDTLVTRLIVRNDRTYEFIHLKDHRAAGCEPLEASSGYRWNSDLSYYQEIRDSATHFFIESLPAGSHVLEYRVKIQHAGLFQSGIGEIECLYAPEFRARSGSLELKVE